MSKKPDTVTQEEWDIYRKVHSEIAKLQPKRPREYYQRIVNKRWAEYRKKQKSQNNE